ncbi:MAG: hypothetical protein ABWK00_04530 [Desulfurococcaceae archaeon]
MVHAMYEQIVQVLAFLGAQRDYSYIDRIGNAIDETTIMESVRDSLRAYYALCSEAGKCIDVGKGRGIRCPELKKEDLERAVNSLAAMVGRGSRVDIIRLSREIAMKAYAAIPRFLSEEFACKPEG